MTAATATETLLCRALPGHIIDLIRDGVPRHKVRQQGRHAITAALRSTAGSAMQRGWAETEWASLVTGEQNELRRQVRLDHRGIDRGRLPYESALRSAWKDAARWLATAPPPMRPGTASASAAAHLAAVKTAWTGPPGDLTILTHLVGLAVQRGTLTPSCPRRTLMEVTGPGLPVHGLGLTALRSVITRLVRAGALEIKHPGAPAGPTATRRRAAVYAIPSRPKNMASGAPCVASGAPHVTGLVVPLDSVGERAVAFVSRAAAAQAGVAAR